MKLLSSSTSDSLTCALIKVSLIRRRCGCFFFLSCSRPSNCRTSFHDIKLLNIISCVYIELGLLLHVTTSFNFLYVTVFKSRTWTLVARGHDCRGPITDGPVFQRHRWGFGVGFFFCSNSWPWSGAVTLTMVGVCTDERKDWSEGENYGLFVMVSWRDVSILTPLKRQRGSWEVVFFPNQTFWGGGGGWRSLMWDVSFIQQSTATHTIFHPRW